MCTSLWLLLAPLTCAAGEQRPEGPAARRVSRYNVVWNSPSKDPQPRPWQRYCRSGLSKTAIWSRRSPRTMPTITWATFTRRAVSACRSRPTHSKLARVSAKRSNCPPAPSASKRTASLCGFGWTPWPGLSCGDRLPREVAVAAQPEFWKAHCLLRPQRRGRLLAPESSLPGRVPRARNGMLWYYAVGDDSVFPDDLKFYAVEEHGGEFPRSVPVNTFGNLLESPELTVSHGVLRGSGKRFDIRIHSRDADAGVRALGRSSARRREAGIPGETGKRQRSGGRHSGTGAGSRRRTARSRSKSREATPVGRSRLRACARRRMERLVVATAITSSVS